MPTWLAPEVILGDLYTEKADIYAFGVILYELITRKHPFKDMVRKDFNYLVEDLIISGVRPDTPAQFEFEYAPEYSLRYCSLMQESWSHYPHDRPDIKTITSTLQSIYSSI